VVFYWLDGSSTSTSSAQLCRHFPLLSSLSPASDLCSPLAVEREATPTPASSAQAPTTAHQFKEAIGASNTEETSSTNVKARAHSDFEAGPSPGDSTPGAEEAAGGIGLGTGGSKRGLGAGLGPVNTAFFTSQGMKPPKEATQGSKKVLEVAPGTGVKEGSRLSAENIVATEGKGCQGDSAPAPAEALELAVASEGETGSEIRPSLESVDPPVTNQGTKPLPLGVSGEISGPSETPRAESEQEKSATLEPVSATPASSQGVGMLITGSSGRGESTARDLSASLGPVNAPFFLSQGMSPPGLKALDAGSKPPEVSGGGGEIGKSASLGPVNVPLSTNQGILAPGALGRSTKAPDLSEGTGVSELNTPTSTAEGRSSPETLEEPSESSKISMVESKEAAGVSPVPFESARFSSQETLPSDEVAQDLSDGPKPMEASPRGEDGGDQRALFEAVEETVTPDAPQPVSDKGLNVEEPSAETPKKKLGWLWGPVNTAFFTSQGMDPPGAPHPASEPKEPSATASEQSPAAPLEPVDTPLGVPTAGAESPPRLGVSKSPRIEAEVEETAGTVAEIANNNAHSRGVFKEEMSEGKESVGEGLRASLGGEELRKAQAQVPDASSRVPECKLEKVNQLSGGTDVGASSGPNPPRTDGGLSGATTAGTGKALELSTADFAKPANLATDAVERTPAQSPKAARVALPAPKAVGPLGVAAVAAGAASSAGRTEGSKGKPEELGKPRKSKRTQWKKIKSLFGRKGSKAEPKEAAAETLTVGRGLKPQTTVVEAAELGSGDRRDSGEAGAAKGQVAPPERTDDSVLWPGAVKEEDPPQGWTEDVGLEREGLGTGVFGGLGQPIESSFKRVEAGKGEGSGAKSPEGLAQPTESSLERHGPGKEERCEAAKQEPGALEADAVPRGLEEKGLGGVNRSKQGGTSEGLGAPHSAEGSPEGPKAPKQVVLEGLAIPRVGVSKGLEGPAEEGLESRKPMNQAGVSEWLEAPLSAEGDMELGGLEAPKNHGLEGLAVPQDDVPKGLERPAEQFLGGLPSEQVESSEGLGGPLNEKGAVEIVETPKGVLEGSAVPQIGVSEALESQEEELLKGARLSEQGIEEKSTEPGDGGWRESNVAVLGSQVPPEPEFSDRSPARRGDIPQDLGVPEGTELAEWGPAKRVGLEVVGLSEWGPEAPGVTASAASELQAPRTSQEGLLNDLGVSQEGISDGAGPRDPELLRASEDRMSDIPGAVRRADLRTSRERALGKAELTERVPDVSEGSTGGVSEGLRASQGGLVAARVRVLEGLEVPKSEPQVSGGSVAARTRAFEGLAAPQHESKVLTRASREGTLPLPLHGILEKPAASTEEVSEWSLLAREKGLGEAVEGGLEGLVAPKGKDLGASEPASRAKVESLGETKQRKSESAEFLKESPSITDRADLARTQSSEIRAMVGVLAPEGGALEEGLAPPQESVARVPKREVWGELEDDDEVILEESQPLQETGSLAGGTGAQGRRSGIVGDFEGSGPELLSGEEVSMAFKGQEEERLLEGRAAPRTGAALSFDLGKPVQISQSERTSQERGSPQEGRAGASEDPAKPKSPDAGERLDSPNAAEEVVQKPGRPLPELERSPSPEIPGRRPLPRSAETAVVLRRIDVPGGSLGGLRRVGSRESVPSLGASNPMQRIVSTPTPASTPTTTLVEQSGFPPGAVKAMSKASPRDSPTESARFQPGTGGLEVAGMITPAQSRTSSHLAPEPSSFDAGFAKLRINFEAYQSPPESLVSTKPRKPLATLTGGDLTTGPKQPSLESGPVSNEAADPVAPLEQGVEAKELPDVKVGLHSFPAMRDRHGQLDLGIPYFQVEELMEHFKLYPCKACSHLMLPHFWVKFQSS
jgi:hypothetical protein